MVTVITTTATVNLGRPSTEKEQDDAINRILENNKLPEKLVNMAQPNPIDEDSIVYYIDDPDDEDYVDVEEETETSYDLEDYIEYDETLEYETETDNEETEPYESNHTLEILKLACDGGSLEIVKYMHKEMNLIAEHFYSCGPVLQNAIIDGRTDLVKYLHEEVGLYVNGEDVCFAIRAQHLELANYLLRAFTKIQ